MARGTTLGQYEYLVMPYGLLSDLLVFKACINYLLKDMLVKFVITYIDIIIIYSNSLV